VVAVSISTATTHRAYQEIYQSIAGRAALEVVAAGGGTFQPDFVPALEHLPGVKAVAPEFQQLTKLHRDRGEVPLTILGVDPARDVAVHDFQLVEGTLFGAEPGALMDAGFAKTLDVKAGDEVRISTYRLRQNVKILGLLAPQSGVSIAQLGVLFMPLDAVQRLFRKPGAVNTVAIVLDDAAQTPTIQAEIGRRLPPGLTARAPAARTQMAEQTLQNAEQGLKYAYALMLVLAVFMIFNTFLMNVGERRRQLAILRAIGTTRWQIIGMLAREGLFMGLVGTVLGSALGLAGAMLLARAVSQIYTTAAAPALEITIGPFLLAILIGPGMACVAMFVPAYLASRIPAMEGIRPAIAKDGARVPWSFTLSGIVAFAVTGGMLVACVVGRLPLWLATWAGAMFTAAFVLLIPAVLGPLTRLAAFLLRPIVGIEGRLAQRQVVRRRTRTTLTIGVLYVAISSGIALGTIIINNVQDLREWVDETFRGDFIVRAPGADLSSDQATVLPESLGTELRTIPGVENVDTIRAVRAQAGDQGVLVLIHEFTRKDHLSLHLQEGDPEVVRRRLQEGEVVVGSILATRLGVRLGELIPLETTQGRKQLRIAGITTEYMVGSIVHMDRSAGKRLLGVEGVNVFLIKAAGGDLGGAAARLKSLADVYASLKAFCGPRELFLQSFSDLRLRVESIAHRIIASLWGLLGLMFVVAAFAITNTLTMNVLEQTRDLALLRVVAMTRWQVRKTILSQASIMGLIGLVTGVVGGMIGAYITNLCSRPLLGQSVAFALNYSLLVGVALASLGIILAAAWFPAERAARLNLLIALKYE
jgi:putative ABC transport system permease protein